MIITDIKKYDKQVNSGRTIICNSIEESFYKIIDSGLVPEFIICDPIHKMMFKAEIKYFSVPDKIINVSALFTVVMVNGYRVEVLTKEDTGNDAFKGIELYGRCK